MNKERTIETAFLFLILILGIFYIYLATQTAFLGEDEATYFSLGKQISNLEYPTTNHLGIPITAPIFVPMIYAFFFVLFGPSLALAKIISVVFGLLTLLVVYLLGRKINIYVGIFSVSVLFSIFLFTHFMLIAYVDVPIAFFSVISLYLITKVDSKKSAILAGIALGISYYVKESGLFITFVLFAYSLFVYLFEKDKNQLKLYLLVFTVSLVLVSVNVIKNLALFNYPYLMILDMFFPSPTASASSAWSSAAIQSPPLSSITDFANIFSWVPLILSALSLIYIFMEWKEIKIKSISFSTFLFCLFMIGFIFLYVIGKAIAESRYFILIFPQLALISGFYLWKLKEYKKYFLVIIIPLVLFGVYSTISIAISTSQTSRFPVNYIEALDWIKDNTPKSSLIFTTYGGSVKYFADRDIVWSSIEEFPQLMTTQNSTYIYDTLKKYNVSYILVWSGVLSQNYIIPESNIAGVFTYNFLNTVSSDTQNFNATYQNQDNIIFRVV
jgi:4-amino-4-deoxy-L-arabinose transferase-like glycosyltransferase